jgi:hypothetical protein
MNGAGCRLYRTVADLIVHADVGRASSRYDCPSSPYAGGRARWEQNVGRARWNQNGGVKLSVVAERNTADER